MGDGFGAHDDVAVHHLREDVVAGEHRAFGTESVVGLVSVAWDLLRLVDGALDGLPCRVDLFDVAVGDQFGEVGVGDGGEIVVLVDPPHHAEQDQVHAEQHHRDACPPRPQ